MDRTLVVEFTKKQQVLDKYLIKNHKPMGTNTRVENQRSGSVVPNEGTLYDTPSNLLVMRSMNGDCLIRTGWCLKCGKGTKRLDCIDTSVRRSSGCRSGVAVRAVDCWQ